MTYIYKEGAYEIFHHYHFLPSVASNTYPLKISTPNAHGHAQKFGSCLKTGQHYIFVNIIRKIKNNARLLDTLFIDDFIDIMEQYFHY